MTLPQRVLIAWFIVLGYLRLFTDPLNRIPKQRFNKVLLRYFLEVGRRTPQTHTMIVAQLLENSMWNPDYYFQIRRSLSDIKDGFLYPARNPTLSILTRRQERTRRNGRLSTINFEHTCIVNLAT